MSNVTKKSKVRINVIDVIIILLVLALIATAVYKIYSEVSNSSLNKHSKYIVSFRCDSEYESLLKYLKDGDAVYCVDNDILLGYLYDVPDDGKNTVYKYVADNGEEETGKTMSSSYLTASFKGTLRLASNAVKAKNGNYYSVEDMNISVGSTIEVYTEKTVFTLTVEEIMFVLQ